MKPLSNLLSAQLKEPKLVAKKSIHESAVADSHSYAEGLKMVDTVKVRYNVRVDTDLLEEVGWDHGFIRNKRSGRSFRYFYKTYKMPNGSTITASYRPNDFTKRPNLSFEFSVQKIALGNNYQIWPGDVSTAGINHELKKITDGLGIEPLDIKDGEITRVDIGKNWQVGDKDKDYIRYLSKCNYSRRSRDTYQNKTDKSKEIGEDNGVSFSSRYNFTKAYEKYEEAKAPESKGILRLETSILGSSNINKLFGKKHPKVSDITIDICWAALQKEIEVLGLDNPIIGKKSWIESLKILVAKDTITKGMMQKLLGFITTTQDYPNLDNQALADLLGISTDTIADYRKKLADGGVSVLDDLTETLPALSLNNPEPFKNSGEVLSNTYGEVAVLEGCTLTTTRPLATGNIGGKVIASLIISDNSIGKSSRKPYVFNNFTKVPIQNGPRLSSFQDSKINKVNNAAIGKLVVGKVAAERAITDDDAGQSLSDSPENLGNSVVGQSPTRPWKFAREPP